MSDPTSPDRASDLTVTHEQSVSKGRDLVRLEGSEAEMTYTPTGEYLMIIDHTSVPEALRGRGLGEILVQHAVDDA
jgi:predicted GNAT family acetyltransferase